MKRRRLKAPSPTQLHSIRTEGVFHGRLTLERMRNGITCSWFSFTTDTLIRHHGRSPGPPLFAGYPGAELSETQASGGKSQLRVAFPRFRCSSWDIPAYFSLFPPFQATPQRKNTCILHGNTASLHNGAPRFRECGPKCGTLEVLINVAFCRAPVSRHRQADQRFRG